MSNFITMDSGIPDVSPICFDCVRETGYRKCEAFPDEIPLEIWLGDNNHKKPFPGDHGLQFKAYETATA
jgi:hypothetical protein